MTAKLKPEVSVTITPQGKLVITQKRLYKRGGDARNYTVSLTLDEARMVARQIERNIALADELQRTGLS